MLADWAREVAEGKRPAMIFSSTAIETGAPLVFSTTAAGCSDRMGLRSFHRVYGGWVDQHGKQVPPLDIRVVTAARLSAAFPFVSPTARPDRTDVTPLHLVDGGYYDVYGTLSAIDWIDDGLCDAATATKLRRILLVKIRPFIDTTPPETGKARGWFFQNFAPILGLYNVRGSAQKTNSDLHLDALTLRLKARFGDKGPILTQLDLTYPTQSDQQCNQPPLSWRLSPKQIGCINTAWDDLESSMCAQRHSNAGAAMLQWHCSDKAISASAAPDR
jgi:hypothetical protein